MKKILIISLLIFFFATPVLAIGDEWWDRLPRPEGWCPRLNGAGWDGELYQPLQEMVIRYGLSSHHNGLDLPVEEGALVRAAQSGYADWVGDSTGGGRAGGIVVALSHGWGYRTFYGHLSQVFVSCGEWVEKGQIIGLSGKTGTSWAHLHFTVQRYGEPFDPSFNVQKEVVQPTRTRNPGREYRR